MGQTEGLWEYKKRKRRLTQMSAFSLLPYSRTKFKKEKNTEREAPFSFHYTISWLYLRGKISLREHKKADLLTSSHDSHRGVPI